MVVTEALARGLPVVATDVGGVPRGARPRGRRRRPGAARRPGRARRALRRWLTDPGCGTGCAAAARAGDALTGWDEHRRDHPSCRGPLAGRCDEAAAGRAARERRRGDPRRAALAGRRRAVRRRPAHRGRAGAGVARGDRRAHHGVLRLAVAVVARGHGVERVAAGRGPGLLPVAVPQRDPARRRARRRGARRPARAACAGRSRARAVAWGTAGTGRAARPAAGVLLVGAGALRRRAGRCSRGRASVRGALGCARGPRACVGDRRRRVARVAVAATSRVFLVAARTAGLRRVADPAAAARAGGAASAMRIPLNVAGWGPREGVAAWAFAAAGLGAAQGSTAAVLRRDGPGRDLPGLLVLARHRGCARPRCAAAEAVRG